MTTKWTLTPTEYAEWQSAQERGYLRETGYPFMLSNAWKEWCEKNHWPYVRIVPYEHRSFYVEEVSLRLYVVRGRATEITQEDADELTKAIKLLGDGKFRLTFNLDRVTCLYVPIERADEVACVLLQKGWAKMDEYEWALESGYRKECRPSWLKL